MLIAYLKRELHHDGTPSLGCMASSQAITATLVYRARPFLALVLYARGTIQAQGRV